MQIVRHERPEAAAGDSRVSVPDLINDLTESLPKYITLSSNTWGLRSLLPN